MFSFKNLVFLVIVIGLLVLNGWQYKQVRSVNDELDATIEALADSESGIELHADLLEVTAELREEQAERTKQTQRAVALEQTNKEQRREIAELGVKMKALEAEVRRSKRAVAAAQAEAQKSAESTSSASVTPVEVVEQVASISEAAIDESTSSAAQVGVTETTSASSESTDTEAAAKLSSSDASSGRDVVYVIKKGDLLQNIARTYYGDSTQWPKILAANTDVVTDVKLLRPGMKITLPDVPD